ncbi:hypothetical protein RRG08_052019 [Elysia crispata]|uniref:Neurotransmitter-gated ion-channel transmembrane domain-containing protein n=1 Tax=Elysia crispata TaxID=231223 RepID=A0AAE1CZ25_9GAST|nr:hypothetical protein RRG08_052019 [Elysia crispata]
MPDSILDMDLLSVRSVALVIFVGLLVALGPPQVLAATKADMYNLHDDLFTTRGYKKQVRPIEFDSNSLFVYMAFSLLSLVDVIFLSLTSTLVFALPAEAGEKISMGITVLLAYAVYLTIVSDHLPNTSVQPSPLTKRRPKRLEHEQNPGEEGDISQEKQDGSPILTSWAGRRPDRCRHAQVTCLAPRLTITIRAIGYMPDQDSPDNKCNSNLTPHIPPNKDMWKHFTDSNVFQSQQLLAQNPSLFSQTSHLQK